MSKFSVFLG